jgi:hypothetical protein
LPLLVDADIVNGDDIRVLEQRGQPCLANEWVKEQLARAFMLTGHGDMTITVSIKDLEDAFHAANRNQFSLTVALLQRPKLAVKRRLRRRINLLERLVKQIVQGLVPDF